MVSTPATLPSLSQAAPVNSDAVLYDQWKRRLRCGLQMALYNMQAPSKSDSWSSRAHSWKSPEGQRWSETLQWAQVWAVPLVVYFAWKYHLPWVPQASESTRQIRAFRCGLRWLSLTTMGKSDFTVEVRKYRRSLGQVLVSISPYPVIKVNGKLLIQQPNQGRTTNGLDTSGMKVWVMPAGEELQPAEVLLKVKGVQNE